MIVVSLFVQAFIDGLLILGAWKGIKVLLGIWLAFAIFAQAGLGWQIIQYFMAGLIANGIIGLVFFALMCFAIFVVIKNIKLINEGKIEPNVQPLEMQTK